MKNVRKAYFFFLRDGFSRGKFIKKSKKYNSIGKNLFYQPRREPSEPHLISIGNNVVIASEVLFITHDVMHHMFNNIEKGTTSYKMGSIVIGDNVFIGSRATLLPNTKIGNNVIIGANAVVTRNIPDNSVAIGNPIKIIENRYDKIFNNRKKEHKDHKTKSRESIIKEIWDEVNKYNNTDV
ncbi:hypothetical protein T233_00622 [Vagococcus lutrae LBD1]|uniref:Acetyltransferase n=1 Tax=Vagococcus lutrae LBD1 TaxID=1408226 RepID=V6Q5B5_9ENTE|nr:acyltransferase [Vagococcus lutrae]EST90319.1 hypothetical protein T233_00622 [Vagococcus lutrae LBD1]